ncbi:hypothetical protein FBQ81_10925 [Chloroflexi bacterium CFX6]|nr:hypothetical protein [Chloroflexi bacterium CFX6]
MKRDRSSGRTEPPYIMGSLGTPVILWTRTARKRGIPFTEAGTVFGDEPEIAKAFPNEKAVNDALRLVIELNKVQTKARHNARWQPKNPKPMGFGFFIATTGGTVNLRFRIAPKNKPLQAQNFCNPNVSLALQNALILGLGVGA